MPVSEAELLSALACRDRRAAARTPRVSPLTVDIVHTTRGRVRLRLQPARAADAPRLAALMARQGGVLRTRSSGSTGAVVVWFDARATSAPRLHELARRSDPRQWPAPQRAPRSIGKSRTLIDTGVLLAVASGAIGPTAQVVAVALTALPSARRAVNTFSSEKRLSVDVLDVAAVVTSLVTARCTTAALMTWLLAIGDWVLERTTRRAHAAITPLLALQATEAWRKTPEGRVRRVAAGELAVGDRIVVYASERIPADGVVVDGEGVVDTRAMTGESRPSPRRRGDRVLAATALVDGQVEIRVERAGAATAAARIVRLVEEAASKPMSLQRNAQRAADRLVLPTLAVAALVGVATGDWDRMTSVLITDFGTGLRIALPTVALVGMTLAAREGILVKGGQHLERLAGADVIAFDKTGTLTQGAPELLEVTPLGRLSAEDVVALAAAAEVHQRHPAALALQSYAKRCGVTVPVDGVRGERSRLGQGVIARVGGHDVVIGRRSLLRAEGVDLRGVEVARARHRARVASSIYVAVDGRLEAGVAYADAPRPESAEVVAALRRTSIGRRRRIVLISGDAHRTAEAIGRRVGVDQVIAGLLPEEKAKRVRAIQAAGHTVAMVGDGINDAPALALADVGVSLRGSTDVAVETADVVLLDEGLRLLPRAFTLAENAMRRVRRALAIVIVPNAAAIVLGAAGLLPPAAAAAINNGSTVMAALAAVWPLTRKSRRGPARGASSSNAAEGP